jgi:hypothetical protein
MAWEVFARPCGGNDGVRWSAASSLGISSAFQLAMALGGSVVIPLPQGCFAHPSLVWPILQDIVAVPLQLTAVWAKTQPNLSSMAPTILLAIAKNIGAIAMMTVAPYHMYGVWVSFAGLALLTRQLCQLSVDEVPKEVHDRMISTIDLLIIGWGSELVVEGLLMAGVASDTTMVKVYVLLDLLLTKLLPSHLVTK